MISSIYWYIIDLYSYNVFNLYIYQYIMLTICTVHYTRLYIQYILKTDKSKHCICNVNIIYCVNDTKHE